jgi:hypothetical protein
MAVVLELVRLVVSQVQLQAEPSISLAAMEEVLARFRPLHSLNPVVSVERAPSAVVGLVVHKPLETPEKPMGQAVAVVGLAPTLHTPPLVVGLVDLSKHGLLLPQRPTHIP